MPVLFLRNCLLSPLFRRWWLLLAAMMIAVAAKAYALSQQSPIYVATTAIRVGHSDASETGLLGTFLPVLSSSTETQLANTYAELARREVIRAAVKERLGINDFPFYKVRVIPGTSIIEIAVAHSNPAQAQIIANELAYQLVQHDPFTSGANSPRRRFIRAQLAYLDEEFSSIASQLVHIRDLVAKGLYSADYLAEQRVQLTKRIFEVSDIYFTLASQSEFGAANNLTIVEPAPLPTTPWDTRPMESLAKAAAIGLLLAVGGAYLIEYFEDVITGEDDVHDTLGLVVMGTIPIHSPKSRSLFSEMTQNLDAYQRLRVNLDFSDAAYAIKQMVIASISPNECVVEMALLLGATYARMGKQVVVIDADFYQPRLHVRLALPNATGITSAFLSDAFEIDRLLQAGPLDNLSILTSGPPPPDPSALIASHKMPLLLQRLQSLVDILLIIGPPMAVAADAHVLSSLSDGILIAINPGMTRISLASHAVQELNHVGVRSIGAVLCVKN